MGRKKKNGRRAKKPKRRKRIAEPPKRRLLLPPSGVIQPLAPHDGRMAESAFPIIPREGTPEANRLQKLMDMDVAFQWRLKGLQKRLPHLAIARMHDGSGLQLSKMFRWYFLEYLNRLFKHGPESFPTSFNIVEAFMTFNQDYMFFELRNEVEHLLSLDDYFRWYNAGEIPKKPEILADILPEGTIYSYEMVSNASGLRIAGDRQQVLAGVSFVRHEYELSCLLLAGENPPLHSDEDISEIQCGNPAPGRDDIVADPQLTTQDRFLDGYAGFAKVIVLSRFDLKNAEHDVRFVNLDNGPSFTVFTDDSSIFEDLSPNEADRRREYAIDGLGRYDDLFAALASMIYLPAFFAACSSSIRELRVTTDLRAMREQEQIQKTIKELGESHCVSHRTIRCLPVSFGTDDVPQRTIDPPTMNFKCHGYWKAIGPQEIGEDKNGEPIVGRTWVSRHESWSAGSPESFLLQRNRTEPKGPDPGVIYVQRSPAHDVNVYKVGLTRRSAAERAKELSSATAVPLPFGVLATWDVGDCAFVEREVHRELAAYRINPRREFFHAELSLICGTIESVIGELS